MRTNTPQLFKTYDVVILLCYIFKRIVRKNTVCVFCFFVFLMKK